MIVGEILKHAEQEYPKEACGLIIDTKGHRSYIPCRNIAANPLNDFVIEPKDYVAACRKGFPLAAVHSHPDEDEAILSPTDEVSMKNSRLPYVICAGKDIGIFYPENSYVKREFITGIADCYNLVRDYYKDSLGIKLRNFIRDGEWWKSGEENIIVDSYTSAGFYKVDKSKPIKVNDVILMKVASRVPNHLGVYLGEDRMLHHMYGAMSQKLVYGDNWRSRTVCYLRYDYGNT